jgi:predicted secreted Zn-dependent protease
MQSLNRQRAPAVVMVWLSMLSFSVHAKYDEQLQYVYYDVQPRHGQGLFSAVQAASPIRQDNEIFQGFTNSKIGWSLQTQSNGALCHFSAIAVTINTTITLPVLRSAKSSAQKEFAVFLQALQQHELGHLQLNQATAKQLEYRLHQLPARGDCQALLDEADAIGTQLMQTMAAVNKEYDRRTQHGKTQGIVLSD